ncbi:signal recognition particle-docking protein FtsY [Actinomadura fibrosa]|uniref:Signal recognition particle receptor FtsY n=2 Tax=Actinomadura fibrosa TaxID=111802 RepID=A0ABW2XYB0_9ACTN
MEYLIVIAVLAVVALVVGGVLFLRPGRRGPRPPVEPAEPPRGGATAVDEAGAAAPTIERAPPTEAPPPPPTVEIEQPPPGAGRLVRLRARLARSQNAFGKTLLGLLSRDTLDDDAWEEIEDTLITADMGASVARQVTDDLRTRVQVLGTRTPEEVRALLKDELVKQIGPDLDRSVKAAPHGNRPAVLMVVGVNGTGKTTTCGKLARVLVGDGHTVLLGAADTFRAAAADQLETWGNRVGAQVVRKGEGADPASVAFDAVKQGIDTKVDVVIVDTAGRLHTKTGLMDELGKVKRVVEKQAAVDEVLLVLDATTGQNGMQQARVFAEVVNVTGVVLTKLDGTAKGGIVVQVQRELGVPVKLVGLGEGPDDLAPFEPEAFVDAILGD